MSKEIAKKKQLENEINSLREQAKSVEKENMAIFDRIAYLGSRDYQEVQAKDKLNLQNPDEKVVIVAQRPSEEATAKEPAKNEFVPNQNKTPNFQKWLEYFFKK